MARSLPDGCGPAIDSRRQTNGKGPGGHHYQHHHRQGLHAVTEQRRPQSGQRFADGRFVRFLVNHHPAGVLAADGNGHGFGQPLLVELRPPTDRRPPDRDRTDFPCRRSAAVWRCAGAWFAIAAGNWDSFSNSFRNKGCCRITPWVSPGFMSTSTANCSPPPEKLTNRLTSTETATTPRKVRLASSSTTGVEEAAIQACEPVPQ